MCDINSIADKIEQALSKTFSNFSEQKSGMYNYALLFDSKKENCWIIVLFFNDNDNLKNLLNNGFCHSVYQFLKNEILLIDKQLPIRIKFDTGKYPANEIEYRQLLDKHIVKYDVGKNENGKQKICTQCGHDWGKHKLMGYGEPPREGWMVCPEKDCFCFNTWDLDIRVSSEDFLKGERAKKE